MKFIEIVNKFGIKPDSNGFTKAKTPVFRSSYAFVVEPRKTDDGVEKYSICIIFNKKNLSDWKEVFQATANATAKMYGSDPMKWPKNLKFPFHDGDEERDGKEYEGCLFFNAGSVNKPKIVDRGLNPIFSKDEFYSGCYARASLSFYPFDKAGNKGAGCGLNNLLFWEHGERLDGQSTAEEDFAEFAKTEDKVDEVF